MNHHNDMLLLFPVQTNEKCSFSTLWSEITTKVYIWNMFWFNASHWLNVFWKLFYCFMVKFKVLE